MPDDSVSRGGVDVVRLAAALPDGAMQRFEALLAEVYAAGWAAGRKETLRGVSEAVGLLPAPGEPPPRTARSIGVSIADMMWTSLRHHGAPMWPADLRQVIGDRYRARIGNSSIGSVLHTDQKRPHAQRRFRRGLLDGRLRIGLAEWDDRGASSSGTSGE